MFSFNPHDSILLVGQFLELILVSDYVIILRDNYLKEHLCHIILGKE